MVAETIVLEDVNDALDKLRRGGAVRSVIRFG
jgi:Zn-dependent alcohol dehydrogenase